MRGLRILLAFGLLERGAGSDLFVGDEHVKVFSDKSAIKEVHFFHAVSNPGTSGRITAFPEGAGVERAGALRGVQRERGGVPRVRHGRRGVRQSRRLPSRLR